MQESIVLYLRDLSPGARNPAGECRILLTKKFVYNSDDLDSPSIDEAAPGLFHQFAQEGDKILQCYPGKEHRDVYLGIWAGQTALDIPLEFLQFLNKYGLTFELSLND